MKTARFWEGQRWTILPASSFAIQCIVLRARTMTVLVRESEESLSGRLRCKLEDKNEMDCTVLQ